MVFLVRFIIISASEHFTIDIRQDYKINVKDKVESVQWTPDRSGFQPNNLMWHAQPV